MSGSWTDGSMRESVPDVSLLDASSSFSVMSSAATSAILSNASKPMTAAERNQIAKMLEKTTMNPETNRLPQRPREHEADELALSRVTTKLGTETICGLLSKLPAVTSTLQSAVTTSADACNTCHSQHDRLSNGNKAKGKNKCSKENKDQHEDRHEEDNDEDEASFLSGLLVENKETLSCREHEQAMRSLNSKWRRTLRRTEKQLVTQSKIFQAERKSLELKIESAIASAETSSTMGADKGGNNGHDEDSQQSAEIIAALEGIKYQHKQDMQEAVEQARKQERNHMERQMKKTLDMCQKNSMILGNAAATAIEDQERLFDEHQQELDDVAARHRLDMATMQRLYDHRLEEQRRQFEADLGQQQAKFDNELERRLRDLTSLYESKLRASPASIVSEMIPFQEGERDDEQNSSQATYSETDFDIDKRHEVEARDERIEELEQTLAAMQLDHENEIAIIQEAFEKQTNGMQQTFEQELSWLKLEHEAALAEANAEAHDCELLEREEIDELNQRILNLSNTHQRELLDLSISHQREKLEAIEKAVQDTAEQLQSDHDENLIRLRVDLEDEKQNALDELRGCLEADETRSEDSLGVSKARSKRTLLADDASEEHCRTLEEELDQCREDLQKMKSQTNSLMEQHQQEIDELEQAHTERINELMSDHQVEIEKMYETRISEEEEELGEKTDCCCEDLQRQLFVSRSQVAEANKHLREAEELHNSHFQRLNASFAAQKETLECELERLTSQYQHSLDERDQTIDALNSQSSGLKDQISVYEAKVHSMSERHQADVSSLREMVEHIKTERDSILSEKERLVEGHASTLKANEEAMECLQSAFRKAETEIATLQATTEQLQDKHRTELQNLANQLSNCERCRSHEMEILKTQALLKASQRECMELQQRIDRSTPERGRSHRQSETSGAGEEGSKVALDSLFLKEMLLDSGLNDSMRLESPQTPGGRFKKKQRAESLQPEVAETTGVLSPVNRPPLLRRTSSAQSFRSLATISPVMERSVAGVAVTKARSKGSRASSQKRKVRIMLLGVSSTAKVRKFVSSLNAELVDRIEDAHTATHVVAGDKSNSLRRTPKLLIALCKTGNILSMDWLVQSHKSGRLLTCGRFLLLHDREAEDRYRFCMKRTLQNGFERRKEGGLLAGWRVLFCDGVASNKAPSAHELALIVAAAGGVLVDLDDVSTGENNDPTKVIVVTSDPPHPNQLASSRALQVSQEGAGLFTITWLLDCIMQQKLTGIK